MADNNSYILWLPSWYPSKLDKFNGDFIQRHANSLALYKPVQVLYVIKDSNRLVTQNVKIERNDFINLSETIIYYAVPKYLPGIAGKIYSLYKYFTIYKKQLQLHFEREGKPKFVHVHVAFKAGLIALYLKWKFGIVYFVTEHWSGYNKKVVNNYFKRNIIFRFLVKKIFQSSNCVIPVSIDLGEKIKTIESSILIKIIPNVVDEQLFYFNETKNEKFQIVHYTSLDIYSKNSIGLLEVLNLLHKKRDDWECVIYGPAIDSLCDFVFKNQLQQNVKFVGEISHFEVAALLKKSDLFVSFSTYETQSCSILESLCCGVPVIATKVGGIPEIINSENGILIESNDEPALLLAIESMMLNYKNYNRKSNAISAQKKYSQVKVGAQLLSLYQAEF